MPPGISSYAATRFYGAALLKADTKRLKETTAIGLDETLFVRAGRYKDKAWSTTVCEVANHQLIDVLETREFTRVERWFKGQPHHVKERLECGCLDMSKTYNAVFRVVTPKATRVIDRFHVTRRAILAVDQTRRRVQQRRLGHRGRASDPLYRARKLLVIKAATGRPSPGPTLVAKQVRLLEVSARPMITRSPQTRNHGSQR
jgi:transposase